MPFDPRHDHHVERRENGRNIAFGEQSLLVPTRVAERHPHELLGIIVLDLIYFHRVSTNTASTIESKARSDATASDHISGLIGRALSRSRSRRHSDAPRAQRTRSWRG